MQNHGGLHRQYRSNPPSLSIEVSTTRTFCASAGPKVHTARSCGQERRTEHFNESGMDRLRNRELVQRGKQKYGAEMRTCIAARTRMA